MSYTIGLTHTIDAAHRVVGHQGGRGKCARLHGHTYQFEIEIVGDELDESGFVVDFGDVKRWLDAWDHRTLLWERDPIAIELMGADFQPVDPGVVRLPFNPTAENMARCVAEWFAAMPGVVRATVTVKETPKSRATWTAE